MTTSIEIFSMVNEYRTHTITLAELESWLVPRLALYMENPDSAVGRMAGLIELCLAEFQAGIITERSVRARLGKYGSTEAFAWLRYPNEVQEDVTSSASTPVGVTNSRWAAQSPSWNSEPGVVNV